MGQSAYVHGSPEKVLLIGFKSEKLKALTPKTLGEVARLRRTSPWDTAMDLVIEDDSRVGTVYFLMSEENGRRQIALPWVSFGSDEDTRGIDGVFLKSSARPRAYGNFARVYARYVRDEKLMPLAEARSQDDLAFRRRTSEARIAVLKRDNFADVVVFDPRTFRITLPSTNRCSMRPGFRRFG